MPLKIINIVGARPNFMKIAPLIEAMNSSGQIEQTLVHTGQHYDENLSKIFFDDLGIPRADINLGVSPGDRDSQIKDIKSKFVPVVEDIKPDLILVVGDVTSTIACAEVAKEKGIKVAHVEAGLRSFDNTMPEEINRIETDKIADFLYVTEPSAIVNLKNENVPGEVLFAGNVMIDTLLKNLKKAEQSNILSTLSITPQQYILSTFHRPSNVDSEINLSGLVETLVSMTSRFPTVLPLHPRTRSSLEKFDMLEDISRLSNLRLTEPLGYLDFLWLVMNARVVVTDSGGIQEETTALRIPCITMRENTERPITLVSGTNVLVGQDRDKLLFELDKISDGSFPGGQVPELWDGKAAERIVKHLLEKLGGSRK